MIISKVNAFTLIAVLSIFLFGFTYRKWKDGHATTTKVPVKGCVFKTVMGEDDSRTKTGLHTPQNITPSVDRALSWLTKAQHQDGGWGAGTHANQNILDPHVVKTDPATTAMVSMALLRSGNTLRYGEYSQHLKKGLQHLLHAVENSDPHHSTITHETGTQIQMKLGQNIDVVLTAQFLSNMLDYAEHDPELTNRIKKALERCVAKIQGNLEDDGSMKGAGWAGVLQSSFANAALESAQAHGIKVDESALEKSRTHQKGNFDPKTGVSKTDRGAGVVLYSVTGSARASAKEARKVKEEMKLAKKRGKLPQNAPATAQNLVVIGYSTEDAIRYSTSYEVYESAKIKSQQNDVVSGFGSNGGEEFLSYLQTGESMIINKDDSWQKWYDDITNRLVGIQNDNGSWNGHHCITSPVFCTATCLLVLTVKNDIDRLVKLGGY